MHAQMLVCELTLCHVSSNVYGLHSNDLNYAQAMLQLYTAHSWHPTVSLEHLQKHHVIVTLKLTLSHAPEAQVLACEVFEACCKAICVSMLEVPVHIAQGP